MKKLFVMFAMLAMLTTAGMAQAASYADIAFVIDQSGSMGGEFSWLGNSLNSMNTAVANAGITANYGLAGYEYDAGSADARNIWVDLPSTITDVVNAANLVNTYGGTERHYHAVSWAADNFNWTGSSYAKIMVLITDEPGNYLSSYEYAGLTGEAAMSKKVSDEDILLNVITPSGYLSYWDDVAYSKDAYLGVFDLNSLRTNGEQFAEDFIDAKIQEIIDYTPPAVPEPSTVMLLGVGLLGLVGIGRKRLMKN